MNLYEITANYRALLEAIEAGDIPAEAVNDTIEAAEGDLYKKVENVACYIKNLDAEVDALKAEAAKLKERRDAKAAHAERLRQYLQDALRAAGKSKLETARAAVSIRKSPPAVRIADEKAFIEWAMQNRDDLLDYKPPTISRAAIKIALNGKQAIPGATLEVGESLVIK